MCCQLSSTKVDAQCNKLVTVVGRTKLTVLATFDRLRWPVDHSERVQLCVQHDSGEAARRAGPSATLELMLV